MGNVDNRTEEYKILEIKLLQNLFFHLVVCMHDNILFSALNTEFN